jgi:hypothetical protein
MITLFKNTGDTFAEEIQEALDDLVISYNVEDLAEVSDQNTHIKDGKTIVEGQERIKSWIRELESELKWQRSLSGDGCYIDPETGDSCEII